MRKECAGVLKKKELFLATREIVEEQIQGQIEADFAIVGFYEDIGGIVLDKYINSSIATKAIKI
ncbi:MAG TPA: hypothetical protein H9744_09110 [Candidatus Eisenbergiella stercoravium]|nr:hypothetical protein [Candidatus Eisenbergiella stercoravium]